MDICSRCVTTIPHPALVVGSLMVHGRWVRKLLPVVERMTYLSRFPVRLLNPPKKEANLVQIGDRDDTDRNH